MLNLRSKNVYFVMAKYTNQTYKNYLTNFTSTLYSRNICSKVVKQSLEDAELEWVQLNQQLSRYV